MRNHIVAQRYHGRSTSSRARARTLAHLAIVWLCVQNCLVVALIGALLVLVGRGATALIEREGPTCEQKMTPEVRAERSAMGLDELCKLEVPDP